MHAVRLLALGLLASLGVGGGSADAQSWPSAKPITMVVPFPPGPALDLVARLVGGKVSDALGQTIVVENRSGANGTIGSSLVARAVPDGYTLLAATAGTHVTAVHLMKSLAYDPIKDFTPIIAAVEPVTCLAVHSAVPADTVEDLIAYARSRPDELSYGSSGVGSVFHMMGELFNQTAGVRIKEASSVLDPERVQRLVARLSDAERTRAIEGLGLLAGAADAAVNAERVKEA